MTPQEIIDELTAINIRIYGLKENLDDFDDTELSNTQSSYLRECKRLVRMADMAIEEAASYMKGLME